MKVLIINTSPHKEGCTFTALSEVEKVLHENGIETVWHQVGTTEVRGCAACGGCRKAGKCVFGDKDGVNECRKLLEECDGLIVGSPVHYASVSGACSSLMDRLFYQGGNFAGKPAAAVLSCRRGGASAAFDRMNKYFTISGMPVVSSQYWNSVHGNTPDEVRQDLEGLQIMRTLGRNMAWLLKCIELGRENGITYPEREPRVGTNFIR